MLGYVTTEKAELKMREYEVYSGYYCGVCKSIGERYGQIPRMVLSYDAAFLALLFAGLDKAEDLPAREHCVVHPFKKKTIVRNRAVDYAGDVMLILAWYKLLDDARDEGKLYAKAALKTMGGMYRRLEEKRASLCGKIKSCLEELSALEEARCDSLDQVSDSFARLMEAIMEEGPIPVHFREGEALKRVGYHLGKWIYLMDAVDDIEENMESGAYNPLFYRFSYEPGEADFRGRVMEPCRFQLFHYLGEIGKAVDLLPLRKNRGIVENIVYMGLLRQTEKIAAVRKEE